MLNNRVIIIGVSTLIILLVGATVGIVTYFVMRNNNNGNQDNTNICNSSACSKYGKKIKKITPYIYIFLKIY